jgi:hypothetical protein
MPTNNSIQTFKQNFNGGTRQNRFTVPLDEAFPSVIDFTPNIATEQLKIVSASLPQASVGTISVPYRGRVLNFAGDREYQPWSITVYDDNNSQNLWQAFHSWKEALDGHVTHEVKDADFAYEKLKTNWVVQHLDLNGGNILRQIKLVGCWPEQVGGISLAMNQTDQALFQVSLRYDYFIIEEGI